MPLPICGGGASLAASRLGCKLGCYDFTAIVSHLLATSPIQPLYAQKGANVQEEAEQQTVALGRMARDASMMLRHLENSSQNQITPASSAAGDGAL